MVLAGAELAIRRPASYAIDMLPLNLERSTENLGNTVRGQMIIGGLGSCERNRSNLGNDADGEASSCSL